MVLIELAAALPKEFPASVLIVQHIGAHRSTLPELLTERGRLPAIHPRTGQALQHGTIYIAPPDHHMLVVDGMIRLTREAKENHARPAIDPLFRSAAIAQGPRVIGVILSGRLDDGTAGLQAIKACGGLAVVQDPDDAQEPSMPTSACANVAVDHQVTRANLVDTLVKLVNQTAQPAPVAPKPLVCEHSLSIGEGDAMELLDSIGKPSKIVCPDCNGVLWELTGSMPPRYRCHTGHAFTQRSLEYTQGVRADEALWNALRALEERERLLRDFARTSRERGNESEASRLETEAEHAQTHATQLKRIVGRD